jgi:L-alanine-DL-glutamate epimerase-like enolase superfamily enzyme
MIEDARKRNMRVMVGSMNEGSIGSAAIVHLMPLIDYVDADGPLLLSEDVAEGVVYANGEVSLPQSPGLGITSRLFQ